MPTRKSRSKGCPYYSDRKRADVVAMQLPRIFDADAWVRGRFRLLPGPFSRNSPFRRGFVMTSIPGSRLLWARTEVSAYPVTNKTFASCAPRQPTRVHSSRQAARRP
jgi:hypothetical protein